MRVKRLLMENIGLLTSPRRPRRRVLPLIALVLTAGAACQQPDPKSRRPFVIGAVLSLTGPEATYGVSAKSGIELAMTETKAAEGLLGRRVETIYIDDQSDRAQAEAAAARLLDKEGAKMLIGGVSSGTSIAIAPLAQRARTPMISPAATAPEVTRYGDFVFRACFADPYQAEVIAEHAARRLGVKKVGVLRDLDSTYSLALSEAFTAEAKKLGLEVTLVTELSSTDLDVDAPLHALVAAGAEWVYFPTYVEPARRVLEAARSRALPLRFLGSDGWDARGLASLGPVAEGSIFVSHFDPRADDENVVAFVQRFREAFNEAPDAYAALGYDAARLALRAIRAADSPEPDRLRAALASTRRFEGVTGRIDLAPSGDPKKGTVLMTIRDGKRERISLTR